jgi:hypothetical protein
MQKEIAFTHDPMYVLTVDDAQPIHGEPESLSQGVAGLAGTFVSPKH